jgi:lia operon protein LiaF
MVCWPSLLIALGLLLLLRPQLIGSDPNSSQRLLGDIRRAGSWEVRDDEFWLGIGDLSLDLTETEIPQGETTFRVWGFVTDVKFAVPDDVGVVVSSQAFVSGAKFLGMKRDAILMPLRLVSDDYEAAERRIAIETRFFVGEIKVERG